MFVSVRVNGVFDGGGAHITLTQDDGTSGSGFLPLDPEGSVSVILHPPEQPRDRTSPKRRKRASRKQEQRIADTLGGDRHYGSGNKPGYEGDVRVRGEFRIEAKYTARKSYSVKRAELYKIRSECDLGEEPMFVIDFKEPNTLATEESWVMVPLDVWNKHAKEAYDDSRSTK